MAGTSTRYRPQELEAWTARLLAAAQTPEDIAALVAHHLIEANLAGHDSHGILRIPSYVELADKGQLVPGARSSVVHETPTTAVIDGAHGFGYTTMQRACALAAPKARAAGLGAVAIRHCGHIGRVGGWVEGLARDGLIAQLTVGSLGANSGGAAPFGGAARVLGTNPWAIAVPAAGRAPVLLDFATSSVAEGKLRVARAKQQALPPGWIVGPDGRPSTDVEDFYRGGMLLPFGGHKGYALSVMAALFGGLADAAAPGRLSGVFLLALDPGAFGDADAYTQSVAAAIDTLRATRAAPGSGGVLAPGEPEAASRQLRSRAIPLAAETVRQLHEVAARFTVPFPAPVTDGRLFGEVVVEEFGLTPIHIQAALERQHQEANGTQGRRPLGQLLVAMGALRPEQVDEALRVQCADGS